jgi:hypothetical protein
MVGSASTTGNLRFAVCHTVCRVHNLGHTAKDWLTANVSFVVFPQNQHTAKIWHTANITFCRVPGNKAHDED